MTRRNLTQIARLAVALTLVILALSYLMITRQTGSWTPWFVPVHEDGVRNFLATMFYFEHAAREWPLDVLLAGAVGGAAAFGLGPARTARAAPFWLGAAGVTVVIFLGAAITESGRTLWLNLAQMHTRPGAPLMQGAHWYYHVLSRLALLVAAVALGLAARGATGAAARGWAALLAAPALFAVISALFYDPGLMRNALYNPVFLGHQARELFTHGLTSLPLAAAACLFCAPRPDGPVRGRLLLAGAVLMSLALALGLYIAVGALTRDALSQGQSTDIGVLIFPHFFEHFLGYCLVPFVAAGTYVSLTARAGRASP